MPSIATPERLAPRRAWPSSASRQRRVAAPQVRPRSPALSAAPTPCRPVVRRTRPRAISAPSAAASDAWLVVGTAGRTASRSSSRARTRRTTTCPSGSRMHWGRLLAGHGGRHRHAVQALSCSPGSTVRASPCPVRGACRRSGRTRSQPACPPMAARSCSYRLLPMARPPRHRPRPRRAGSRSSPGRSTGGADHRACPAPSSTTRISPDGTTLYVVEHLAGTSGGALPGPRGGRCQRQAARRVVVDKANLDEAMGGYPIAQVRAEGGMVFTLYRGAEHPFIHALNTIDGWALCIDLPATGADIDAATPDWGLAPTPDRQRWWPSMPPSASLPISRSPTWRWAGPGPSARPLRPEITLAKFGHQQDRPRRPAGRRRIRRRHDLRGRRQRHRSAVGDDLGVTGWLARGTAIDALAVTPDGRTIYALTRSDGRILMIDAATGVALARSRARATIDWWRSSPPPEPTSPLRRFSGIGGKVRDDQPSRTGAHSMPRSRVLIIAGVVIVAAVAIGGFLVYDQVLRGDNVAALTLPSAAPSPAASTATAATRPVERPDGGRLDRRRGERRGRWIDRRRRRHVDGRHRQPGRLPRHRAAGATAGPVGCRRAN